MVCDYRTRNPQFNRYLRKCSPSLPKSGAVYKFYSNNDSLRRGSFRLNLLRYLRGKPRAQTGRSPLRGRTWRRRKRRGAASEIAPSGADPWLRQADWRHTAGRKRLPHHQLQCGSRAQPECADRLVSHHHGSGRRRRSNPIRRYRHPSLSRALLALPSAVTVLPQNGELFRMWRIAAPLPSGEGGGNLQLNRYGLARQQTSLPWRPKGLVNSGHSRFPGSTTGRSCWDPGAIDCTYST